MNKLLILTTGGTIDKVYFDAKSAYEVGQPVVNAVLDAMRVGFAYEVQEVCKKDSLELNDDDRRNIVEKISSSDCAHILITHGTDTMVDTANFIGEQTDKTIVLTGAMQPAAFRETDGIFNIGVAIGILNSAPPGVYIAMSGQSFKPNHVFKNYQTRQFEAK